MKEPLVSVVVVTKNRVKLLQRLLASLFLEIDNNYPNTEVVVIDGGSTDETIALLKEQGSRITSWISEVDSGVAEAANKGIVRARGEVIRLIGDDDEFLPGHFAFMVQYLQDHPEVDVLVGHNKAFFEDAGGRLTYYPQKRLEGRVEFRSMLRFPYDGIFIPECAFFRRRVFERFGKWNESFRYWGYLEYFMRIVKGGACIVVLPRVILTTYQTPASDSIRNNGNARWQWEKREILRKYGNLYWTLWHLFGGEFTPVSPLKWIARKVCGVVGFQPGNILRRLRARMQY